MNFIHSIPRALIALWVFAISNCQSIGDDSKSKRLSPSTENALFVTDAERPELVPVREISILGSQKAVLTFSGLVVDQVYTVDFELTDPSGKQWLPVDSIAFIANGPQGNAWRIFQTDYRTHKPGKWIWSVRVQGMEGSLRTIVTVLPATPTQLETLAKHEKAWESIYRALAHYWTAVDDEYLTKLVDRKELSRTVSVNTYVNIETGARTNTPQQGHKWYGKGEPVYREEASRHKEVSVLEEFKYLRVKKVDTKLTYVEPTQADILNGITYRATGKIGFDVYQFCNPAASGWSEWKQTPSLEFPGMNPAFIEYIRSLGPSVPSELSSKVDCEFFIFERDGNWFVESSRGDRFANGTKIENAERTRMESLDSTEAKSLIKDWRNIKRDSDRQLGDAVKRDPKQIERDIINTMTQFRGRPLSQ